MGVVMVYKEPYSIDANGFRILTKAVNMIILSLIRNHGNIPFDLVR